MTCEDGSISIPVRGAHPPAVWESTTIGGLVAWN